MAIVNTHYGYCGGSKTPKFTYTGTYNVREDGVVELLTSGTLVFLNPAVVDLFLVGGGGAGGRIYNPSSGAGGGGGGYTKTLRKISVTGSYPVVVGNGAVASTGQSMGATQGGASSFGNLASVDGGYSATTTYNGDSVKISGANGGSGGGGGMNGDGAAGYGIGGSDGENGGHGGYSDTAGGTGQGFTTREFGEATGKLYAGGGGGGNSGSRSNTVFAGGDGGGGNGANLKNRRPAGVGVDNTGGGGGGGGYSSSSGYGTPGGNGGSGIVCFRSAK